MPLCVVVAAMLEAWLVVQVRWAGDRCTVCDSDVDYDMDQLVSCDMCGITVHQSCYGVAEVPGEDDMWLCRACELKVTSLLGLCHCPKDQMHARWKHQQQTKNVAVNKLAVVSSKGHVLIPPMHQLQRQVFPAEEC